MEGWLNKQHHKASKVWRGLSPEFGVVRLYRTFSLYSFAGETRCAGWLCTRSGWFKHIEPQRGGDSYLQTEHISACLRLSDEDAGEAEALGAEEGTQVSPRKKGEIRCTGAVETKFSVQSVDKVLRQLQADLLVGATQQLKTIVTNEPTKAKDFKSFSTYGITFGVSIAHPRIVLKLPLDFETNVLD